MERVSFRSRPATTAVVLVCSAAFLLLTVAAVIRSDDPGATLLTSVWQLTDVELLVRFGALADARVWLDGEWWRVGSAGLLHASWLHLILNMVGLWSVGQWTEKAWGPWRSTAVLVASSVIGCLASLAWLEAPVVVGASAGIFGLAGGLLVARSLGAPSTRAAVDPVSARGLGGWLLFWLVVGFGLPLVGVEVIAQAGHVGGLLVGMVLGLTEGRAKAQAVGWTLTLAAAVGLGLAGRAPTWSPNYHLFVGYEYLARHEFGLAADHLELGLSGRPGDPDLSNAVAWALVEADADLERAETLVRGALSDRPDQPQYLDTLGWILCKRGRGEEGLVVLGQAQVLGGGSIPEVDQHLQACLSVDRR